MVGQYVTIAEIVQLVSAAVGLVVSSWGIVTATKDLIVTRQRRLNGMYGYVALVRLRRESSQWLLHVIMMISGAVVVSTRISMQITIPLGWMTGVLITRNIALTAISLVLIMNTMADRWDRKVVNAMSDDEFFGKAEMNRRKTDLPAGKVS